VIGVMDPPVHASDLRALVRWHDELTAEYLEHYGLLPIDVTNERIVVATWFDHPDVQALDDMAVLAGVDVQLVRMGEGELRAAIRRLYSGDVISEAELAAGVDDVIATRTDGDPALDDLVSLANEAPVIKLVNLILLEAVESRASDVHLENEAGGLRIRYRVDGVLQDEASPPPHLRAAIVSRLKIMAELDIAERRIPQDGRIRLRMRDRQIDVRVSTLPALHGESVVLRLLDKETGRIGLDGIGMSDDVRATFECAVSRPHGIVLATGPTGSGKTTTLYAAIDTIRTGREKILTVEDPVEYELRGVPQVQVNEKVGLTFAAALRSLLRQDPDVMLVGEIRDRETADIATHAALTGHLVLSTLHTNDAATALTRLIDLDVPEYLVSSTVEAVLAQRLVRRVCAACVTTEPCSPAVAASLGVPLAAAFPIHRGAGCPHCRGTGYHGRTGIYELLVVDEDIRGCLTHRQSGSELTRIAVRNGMRTLREDGIRQIEMGLTTPEEVLRVTRS
jgi:type II secretion system protein E